MAQPALLRRTPLYPVHLELGARLVEFGGWEMPIQYSSIIDEHLAVRRAAGLFDISHMGEIRVRGPSAGEFLNRTLTNDVRKLVPGRGQYTLMCNEKAGVIDDLYLYRLEPEDYLLVVNASRLDADLDWLRFRLSQFPGAESAGLTDASAQWAMVAVQGPATIEFIDDCLAGERPARALRKNEISRFHCGEAPVWAARTGYTGEDGYEILAPVAAADMVWKRIMAAGTRHGLKPAGLGARDTLRTEMAYPLYGHELNETTTPLEAGLETFVAWEKADFAGRAALAKQKEGGLTRKCMAFRMLDRSAPPRPQYPIWAGEPGLRPLGEVASGTQSPSLNVGIGTGYVPPAFAEPDTKILIEIRGRRVSAVVVRKPIYRRPAAV